MLFLRYSFLPICYSFLSLSCRSKRFGRTKWKKNKKSTNRRILRVQNSSNNTNLSLFLIIFTRSFYLHKWNVGKNSSDSTTIHMIFLAFGIYWMWLFISFSFVTFSLTRSLWLSPSAMRTVLLSIPFFSCLVYFIPFSEASVYIGLCVHNIRNLLVFVASGFRLFATIVSTKAQNPLIKLCPCKRKKKVIIPKRQLSCFFSLSQLVFSSLL